jgi:5-methylcytosine-specific restriction endonuclease McrA
MAEAVYNGSLFVYLWVLYKYGGGIMSYGKLYQFYHSSAWQKVRLLILERDFNLCQKCLEAGQIEPATVIHHKEELTESNIDRCGLDLNNLVSWCRDCHEKHHGRMNEDDNEYTFDADGNIIPLYARNQTGAE